MLNDIAEKQNETRELERLAAQRYLYSRAKKILEVQIFFDLLSPLILAIVVAILPDFDKVAAIIGIGLGIADLLLERYETSYKQKAADIQEMFDCDVLGLECREIQKRRRPIEEEIMQAARKYKRIKDQFPPIENWYPIVVSRLPLHLARLICQRENCWWDSQLRRKYVGLVIGILIFLFLVVFAIGFINGLSLTKFAFAIICPLFPTFTWAFREIRGQREAADEKDKLLEFSEETWQDTINGNLTEEEINKKSRELQDEIYNNRRSNPFILDIFFKRLRDRNEEFINRGAETLVNEALKRLSKNSNL